MMKCSITCDLLPTVKTSWTRAKAFTLQHSPPLAKQTWTFAHSPHTHTHTCASLRSQLSRSPRTAKMILATACCHSRRSASTDRQTGEGATSDPTLAAPLFTLQRLRNRAHHGISHRLCVELAENYWNKKESRSKTWSTVALRRHSSVKNERED